MDISVVRQAIPSDIDYYLDCSCEIGDIAPDVYMWARYFSPNIKEIIDNLDGEEDTRLRNQPPGYSHGDWLTECGDIIEREYLKWYDAEATYEQKVFCTYQAAKYYRHALKEWIAYVAETSMIDRESMIQQIAVTLHNRTRNNSRKVRTLGNVDIYDFRPFFNMNRKKLNKIIRGLDRWHALNVQDEEINVKETRVNFIRDAMTTYTTAASTNVFIFTSTTSGTSFTLSNSVTSSTSGSYYHNTATWDSNDLSRRMRPRKLTGRQLKERSRALRQRRRVFVRSLNLAEKFLHGKDVKLFLSGQRIVVGGDDFDYHVRKTGSVLRGGHGSVDTTMVTKDGVEIGKLCLYTPNTPILDHIASLVMHIRAGLESEIYKTGNLYDIKAHGHETGIAEIDKILLPLQKRTDGREVINIQNVGADLIVEDVRVVRNYYGEAKQKLIRRIGSYLAKKDLVRIPKNVHRIRRNEEVREMYVTYDQQQQRMVEIERAA
jgi:hypothetical protein